MGEALIGPAGPLETIYRALPGARAAAVLCHSHPGQGGSMYDRVLHRVACALHAAKISTLRFNARGVGESAGRFEAGEGEVDDARAAIDRAARDHAALAVVGYSFGAYVGLRAGAGDPRVQRMVGLATPVGVFDFGFLSAIRTPLLLVHGTCDAWAPLAALEAAAAGAGERARVEVVPGGDHAFREQLDVAAAAAVAFLAPLGRA